MSFKELWIDKIDNKDDVYADDLESGGINQIAQEVIRLGDSEESIADIVSTNRTSTIKSISTIDTTQTDYLAHLYTVTGYLQSQAMPNNADGKALWKVNGLTAENLVTNGDFSNGVTGWTANGTVLQALQAINIMTR